MDTVDMCLSRKFWLSKGLGKQSDLWNLCWRSFLMVFCSYWASWIKFYYFFVYCELDLLIISGKTLICCKTAWDDFEKIVKTLGGPMETKRSEELKRRVRIYPDNFGGNQSCFSFSEIQDLFYIYINIRSVYITIYW